MSPTLDPSQFGRPSNVPEGAANGTKSKKHQIPPFVWWTLGLIILKKVAK
jgi:hypothetical protein